MKREQIKASALFLTVFAFFAVSVFVSTDYLKAANPDGVHITVFKTELLADSSATTVLVFSDAAGKTVDIVGNPDVFGQGSGIPVGTYKRIKFTVKNEITYSGPNPDQVTCSSDGATVTKTWRIDSGLAADAQVDLYFATADDGGGTAMFNNGTASYPLLIQSPVEVRADATTIVKLIFNTANTLVCGSGNTVQLLPLTMNALNYVQQPAPAACSMMGEYWFLHYRISATVRDQNGDLVTNPTPTEIMMHAGTVAGWGTVTLSAPSGTGFGTWTVISNQSYTDGGMAEHRHALASLCGGDAYCTNNEGYFDPVSLSMPGFPTTGTGTYSLNGGRMLMSSLEGGYIEGGMSDDCNMFVGVDIASAQSSNMIYAIRKPSDMPATLPANKKYLMSDSQLNIRYSGTTDGSGRYPANELDLGSSMGVIDTGSTGTDGKFFDWKSFFKLKPELSTGAWWSSGPSERAGAFDGSGLAVRSDGLITLGSGAVTVEDFMAVGANGNSISAGGVFDTNYGNHRVAAGLMLNVHPGPTMSDAAGKWVIGVMEARIKDADTTWDNGNEQPEFGISFGEATITATDATTGTFCGGFTYKDSFTGMVYPPEPGCKDIVLTNECYAYNEATNEGLSITTSPGSCVIPGSSPAVPGIVVPVFYVKNQATGSVEAKFALDGTKKVITVWKPIDQDGVPCKAADTYACGDANTSSLSGAGVKVQ